MNLNQLIQEFLDNQRTESSFVERSVERYEYLLKVYQEYLQDEIGVNEKNLKTHLNGVNFEEVFAALRYYVETKAVTSEDTADLFVSVLKTFYKYLKRNGNIENDALIVSFGLAPQDEKSFICNYGMFINKLKSEKIIRYKKSGRPLNDDEIKTLINYCDETIEKTTDDFLMSESNKYNNFVYALITKMIIYTGASEKVISNIKQSDIDITTGTIKIKNIKLLLPFKLRLQMQRYVNVRLLHGIKSLRLFAGFNDEDTDGQGRIGNFILPCLKNMNDLEKKSSVICLAKYTIIEMIRSGMNQNVIQELTGFKTNVFEPCQELVNIEKQEERSKYVNRKLKSLEIYDIL